MAPGGGDVRATNRRGVVTPNYDTRVVEPVVTADPAVDPRELWEGTDAPTLVLRGEDSDVLGASTFEEMLERRSETETLLVDCGRAPALILSVIHTYVDDSRDGLLKGSAGRTGVRPFARP